VDALDLIRYQIKKSYAWLESIVSNVTPEQALWRPGGTANSIAATYAHIVIWADVDLTRHFHAREPLLAGEWGERLGRDERDPREWEPDATFDWDVLHQYGRDVQQHVERLAAGLTAADLGRSFQMKPVELGVWKGIDVYVLHGGEHVWMHGGEIACLKGMQGIRGYGGFMSLYP
jgi:hypothetical protein